MNGVIGQQMIIVQDHNRLLLQLAAEIVEDGETGFLVSPGDAQALADKILLLLHDAGLRRRMGVKGREMVLRRFTMERMIGELEESYLDVLRQRVSGRGQSVS